jgi:FKBP-type peptidyl-prolyl cis-trans isomerase
MRRGGVRNIRVNAELGFGALGATFLDGVIVPPKAELKIEISLVDVSPSYL